VDKGTFGVDEVTDNALWPSAFWLFLEGIAPAGVPSVPNLGGTFSATHIPGLTINPGAPSYEFGDTGDNAHMAQRFRFPFDVQFTTSGPNSSLTVFPAAGAETFFSLSATITVGGAARSPSRQQPKSSSWAGLTPILPTSTQTRGIPST
jgi:hypothetical protein